MPIANVSGFNGESVILVGTEIVPVTKIGQVLYEGDRVQTKEGVIEVTFNDGAILKIRPFTTTMIQEREEKSGFLVFKTKKMVRRITCFVGKLWFKSGESKRRNYLQTPTVVCGLRGTDLDFGYDPNKVQSFLNSYSGDVNVIGDILTGFFEDPGIGAASKSPVYQALSNAYERVNELKQTGKPVDEGRAKIEVLRVVKLAAVELQKNPDENVAKEAEVTSVATDAGVAAVEATIRVEEVKEVKKLAEKALDEAKAAGDEEAVKLAEEKTREAEETIDAVEKAADEAQKAADEAKVAAQGLDLEKVEEATQKAKTNAKIVDTTVKASKKAIAALETSVKLKTAAKEAAKEAEAAKAAGDEGAAKEAETKAAEAAKAAEAVSKSVDEALKAADEVKEAAKVLDAAKVEEAAETIDVMLSDVQIEAQEVVEAPPIVEESPSEGVEPEPPPEEPGPEEAFEEPETVPSVDEEIPIEDIGPTSPV